MQGNTKNKTSGRRNKKEVVQFTYYCSAVDIRQD
jgi:hypothetical protein